ncbi:hypothetical protein T07_13218 [Trichinella nelsoni]|uniref:Uncharacterized protein n=1 Tax=Trichinella nelsoni TaxID=6336 RepID=A0A0V0SL81_9BILA|nr:hypothetical protein T07_13218 [Trichinella nelsoni]
MARRSLMVRWGSGSKPPRNKPLIYRRLTHPGAPLWRNTSVYWSGEDHPGVNEWQHEDEPAKSDNGRTGADPEETNQTTPPSGSLQ